MATARLVATLRSFSQIACGATLLGSFPVLLAWAMRRVYEAGFLPEVIAIQTNTALVFFLAGISLWFSVREESKGSARRIALLCAIAVVLVSLLTLSEYTSGRDLGVDRLLGWQADGAVGTPYPGRMAPNAALDFLLIGAALALLDVETRRGNRPAQSLALAAILVSTVALIGYLYRIESFYVVGSAAMTRAGALMFLLLGAGILSARPTRGLMAIVTSDTPGGFMVRRLSVAVIGVPLALGWIRLAGQRAGIYNSDLGVAIFVVVGMIVLGAIVWRNANALDRIDAERRQAEQVVAHLAAIVESSHDAIVGKTLDGIILSWNAGAEQIYGYRAEEVIGRHVSLLTPPDRADELRELLERLRRGEAVRDFETVRVRKNGERVSVSLTISPVRDTTGRITGASTIARDINERKRVEDALQQSNAVLTGWLRELEKRTQETSLLNELGDLLLTCVSPEEAYEVFHRLAPQLFPHEAGALCVLNASRNLVEATAVWGDMPHGEHVFAPEECWALRRGQHHLVLEPAAELVCQHVAAPVSVGYLCVPMMAHGEALGLLHLRASESALTHPEEGLTEPKQRLALSVARHVGLALANLRLRERLRSQSIRDSLTGLFNRRYMEESLARELRRAYRNQRTLGAILLDLDYFKLFNDTYGHEAGDALLRELGDFLRTHTRREDIACRYGGEEFVLVLPEASIEVTRQRAEQLREEFSRLKVEHHGQKLSNLTVSLGVAVFPEHGGTPEEILRVADRALYRAKTEGRNRVVVGQRPE